MAAIVFLGSEVLSCDIFRFPLYLSVHIKSFLQYFRACGKNFMFLGDPDIQKNTIAYIKIC